MIYEEMWNDVCYLRSSFRFVDRLVVFTIIVHHWRLWENSVLNIEVNTDSTMNKK